MNSCIVVKVRVQARPTPSMDLQHQPSPWLLPTDPRPTGLPAHPVIITSTLLVALHSFHFNAIKRRHSALQLSRARRIASTVLSLQSPARRLRIAVLFPTSSAWINSLLPFPPIALFRTTRCKHHRKVPRGLRYSSFQQELVSQNKKIVASLSLTAPDRFIFVSLFLANTTSVPRRTDRLSFVDNICKLPIFPFLSFFFPRWES